MAVARYLVNEKHGEMLMKYARFLHVSCINHYMLDDPVDSVDGKKLRGRWVFLHINARMDQSVKIFEMYTFLKYADAHTREGNMSVSVSREEAYPEPYEEDVRERP